MSAATSTSQANEVIDSKQSILRRWLEPRSQDRDEAFRERTIRVAIILVITIGLLSFLSSVFVFHNSWSLISFPSFHVVILAGFFIAGYVISRGQIVWAGGIVVATTLLAACGLIMLADEAALHTDLITGIPVFMFTIMVTALVMPSNAILPISAISVVLYALSISGSDGVNVSQVVMTAIFLMPAEGIVLYRLRVEFDARLKAMQESIRRTELAQQQAEDARKQAEDARKQAEEADKAKSQFLANMSHELRTPLNAIIGYDEAMIGGMVGEFTAQQTKLLGHIQHNSRRLLGLINDILDLSKVESGSLQVFLAPMSPQKVIRETVESLRSLADEKHISLTAQFTDEVPEVVLGDANKLQQVLVNIVSNAVKFTDKGGVTVDVSIVDSSNWQFQVRDTGIGMPPNAMAYIFEPFQQVDGTDKRKYKGTGLGLAITKRLVERLGGSIEVISELGKGSTFSIRLPRAHVPGIATKPETVQVQV
jgi:signal transduction histidine kinase